MRGVHLHRAYGRLEGARNVQLETQGHFLPLGDPLVHAAILEAVEPFGL